MTHDVERVLADIDADHGDRCVEFLRHGVLLVLSAPCQLLILAGPEHGRTIPLAEVTPFEQCSQNTGVAKTALCNRARIALLRHSLQIGRVVPLIAPAREPKGCRELRRSFTGLALWT